MNRIFLFDVDGTLALGSFIPESAKESLKKLRKNKDIVMLATGRCIGQMKNILNQIEIDGAICNNGAYAYIGDQVIFESPVSMNTIHDMQKDGLKLTFLARNSYFRVDDDPIYQDFADKFGITCAELKTPEYLEENPVYSLGVQDYTDKVNLAKYHLHFVKVCDLGYDVMNEGISKATAFGKIRQAYPEYQIIAFGDNYNDAEMLEASDIAVVMGQAPDAVKKLAKYITKAPLEDGIAYAVNTYFKGEEHE